MLLSAHQPAYLPWLGYLDKVKQADIFVVLDTVERSHGDWSNRNRIKTQNGVQTLTVPLLGSKNARFAEIETDESKNWRRKHRRAIELAYGTDSSFWYPAYTRFVNICRWQLDVFKAAFEIHTDVFAASGVDVAGDKDQLLINLCEIFDCDKFLFGAQGRDYYQPELWDKAGVEPLFQDYVCKPYPQLHDGEFEPGLSALDMVLNCGGDAKDYL